MLYKSKGSRGGGWPTIQRTEAEEGDRREEERRRGGGVRRSEEEEEGPTDKVLEP